MQTADQRMWRTRDGERLVPDGDPDAAVLAYAVGDEIAKDDVEKLPEAKTEAKAKSAPANKARTKPADK